VHEKNEKAKTQSFNRIVPLTYAKIEMFLLITLKRINVEKYTGSGAS
jgi:hypothetical protein